jgi:hypothetical protein
MLGLAGLAACGGSGPAPADPVPSLDAKQVVAVAGRTHEAPAAGLCKRWSEQTIDPAPLAGMTGAYRVDDGFALAGGSGTGDTMSAARVGRDGSVTLADVPLEPSAYPSTVAATSTGWIVVWSTAADSGVPGDVTFVRYDALGGELARGRTEPLVYAPLAVGFAADGSLDVAWRSGDVTTQGETSWRMAKISTDFAGGAALGPGVAFGETTLEYILDWRGRRVFGQRTTTGIRGRMTSNHLRSWDETGALVLDTPLPLDEFPLDITLGDDGQSAIWVDPGSVTFASLTQEVVVTADVVFANAFVDAAPFGARVMFQADDPDTYGPRVVEVTPNGERSPFASATLAKGAQGLSFVATNDRDAYLASTTVAAVILTCAERWGG